MLVVFLHSSRSRRRRQCRNLHPSLNLFWKRGCCPVLRIGLPPPNGECHSLFPTIDPGSRPPFLHTSIILTLSSRRSLVFLARGLCACSFVLCTGYRTAETAPSLRLSYECHSGRKPLALRLPRPQKRSHRHRPLQKHPIFVNEQHQALNTRECHY